MLQNNSPYWIQYINHILKWEGKTSNDPDDTTAAACVNPGQIHTNKGVTFCTFKQFAASLGITPVTYDRFLKLTNNDVAKFIYRFYTNINGEKYPDSLALSMLEASWLSGQNRAEKHLIDTLKSFGKIPLNMTHAATISHTIPEATLFDKYNAIRWAYLVDFLGNSPKYAKFKKGWANRLTDFKNKYRPGGIGLKIGNSATIKAIGLTGLALWAVQNFKAF